MKIITIFGREYTPFFDDTPDPEDRTTHLYPSQEDDIRARFGQQYIEIEGGNFLVIRNSSLTKITTFSSPIVSKDKPYLKRVQLTTEAENNPQHPRELTDLLEEKGFKII